MKKNNKFIYTTSKVSADKLISLGLTLLQEVNGQYFFLNDIDKLVFEEINEVAYTDKLFL